MPTQVEILERHTAYRGHFRVDRYRLRHEQHRGGLGAVLQREVFERGHIAAVLPVDPSRDEVVLIEQFRPGAYAAGAHPWLIECVAGIIEAGESPPEVARREAREETGCEVVDLVAIGRFLSSPGASSETVALFCGRVDSRRAGGIFGLDEEGEDIRVFTLPVAAAVSMLDEGRILNTKTALALHWLARHYQTLKQGWLSPAS